MSGQHAHKRVNLGEVETEEDILDAIEQSRRITRLIISAVQKGSKFEVSQILEHYGLAMTSRLHFKVVNIVMEQWFSLMGIDDEEQIWGILRKNKYAMNKLRTIRPQGMMVLSDMLTEWELPIGALQSKIIRRIQDHVDSTSKETATKGANANAAASASDDSKQDNKNMASAAAATDATATEATDATSATAVDDNSNSNYNNNDNTENTDANANSNSNADTEEPAAAVVTDEAATADTSAAADDSKNQEK